jgi:hypothetical protein
VAAGNTVVLKPSELTPLAGAWVERLFREAGAPEGIVRVVQGRGETGEALVRAQGIDKVVFTGSGEVGRKVAAAAGERLRPVTLELGGKDPMLVFADADLDRAVAGALWGSFSNCGQVCSAVERIYVEQSLQEAFVEELVRRTRKLRLGRGDELETELGPLVAEERRAHVEELVADAVGRGAELRTGGRRADVGLPGWFYEPTVLSGVDAERAHGARGDLRAGGDRRRLPRRGRGGAPRQRRELRPRRERLDSRPRPARRLGPRLEARVGLDERRLVLVRNRSGLVGRARRSPASAARTASTGSTTSLA